MDAGVEEGFFIDKAGMAADAVMDKFGGKGSKVPWEHFRTQAVALVPPGFLDTLDGKSLMAQLDKQWSRLDPKGTGSVGLGALASFLEAELDKRGQSWASDKAEAGARILIHALDENQNAHLERHEIAGFLQDVMKEAGIRC